MIGREKPKVVLFSEAVEQSESLAQALTCDAYDCEPSAFDGTDAALADPRLCFALILLGDTPEPGLRLARSFGETSLFHGLPFCFLTTSARDVHTEAQAYACGGVDYLTVPEDTSLLRTKLTTLVRLAAGRTVEQEGGSVEVIRLKRALEVASGELERFASVCSHDLREPLRIVILMAQSLDRHYSDKLGKEGKELVDLIVAGSRRLAERIDGILEYSRVTGGQVAAREVDLEESLDTALKALAPAIEKTGATIERGELPRLWGNAEQFVRLFQNLIGNALKFRGADLPKVRISAEKQGNQMRITVADNGIGIDAQYADRLFRIFKRLHRPEEYPGVGIGLAICKRIVESHGGSLWFDSEPGRGASFHFTVSPLREKAEVSAAPRFGSAPAPELHS